MRLLPFSLLVLAACESSSSSSSTSSTSGAQSGSEKETCGGEGTWSKGLGGRECGGTYEMCDGKTTLRVACTGEDGGPATRCQCFRNGEDGENFDAKDTCSSAAYKGQWEVVEARFKSECGWNGYELARK